MSDPWNGVDWRTLSRASSIAPSPSSARIESGGVVGAHNQKLHVGLSHAQSHAHVARGTAAQRRRAATGHYPFPARAFQPPAKEAPRRLTRPVGPSFLNRPVPLGPGGRDMQALEQATRDYFKQMEDAAATASHSQSQPRTQPNPPLQLEPPSHSASQAFLPPMPMANTWTGTQSTESASSLSYYPPSSQQAPYPVPPANMPISYSMAQLPYGNGTTYNHPSLQPTLSTSYSTVPLFDPSQSGSHPKVLRPASAPPARMQFEQQAPPQPPPPHFSPQPPSTIPMHPSAPTSSHHALFQQSRPSAAELLGVRSAAANAGSGHPYQHTQSQAAFPGNSLSPPYHSAPIQASMGVQQEEKEDPSRSQALISSPQPPPSSRPSPPVSRHEQLYASLLKQSQQSQTSNSGGALRNSPTSRTNSYLNEDPYSAAYMERLQAKQEMGAAEAFFFAKSSGVLAKQAANPSAVYTTTARVKRREGWWKPEPPTASLPGSRVPLPAPAVPDAPGSEEHVHGNVGWINPTPLPEMLRAQAQAKEAKQEFKPSKGLAKQIRQQQQRFEQQQQQQQIEQQQLQLRHKQQQLQSPQQQHPQQQLYLQAPPPPPPLQLPPGSPLQSPQPSYPSTNMSPFSPSQASASPTYSVQQALLSHFAHPSPLFNGIVTIEMINFLIQACLGANEKDLMSVIWQLELKDSHSSALSPTSSSSTVSSNTSETLLQVQLPFSTWGEFADAVASLYEENKYAAYLQRKILQRHLLQPGMTSTLVRAPATTPSGPSSPATIGWGPEWGPLQETLERLLRAGGGSTTSPSQAQACLFHLAVVTSMNGHRPFESVAHLIQALDAARHASSRELRELTNWMTDSSRCHLFARGHLPLSHDITTFFYGHGLTPSGAPSLLQLLLWLEEQVTQGRNQPAKHLQQLGEVVEEMRAGAGAAQQAVQRGHSMPMSSPPAPSVASTPTRPSSSGASMIRESPLGSPPSHIPLQPFPEIRDEDEEGEDDEDDDDDEPLSDEEGLDDEELVSPDERDLHHPQRETHRFDPDAEDILSEEEESKRPAVRASPIKAGRDPLPATALSPRRAQFAAQQQQQQQQQQQGQVFVDDEDSDLDAPENEEADRRREEEARKRFEAASQWGKNLSMEQPVVPQQQKSKPNSSRGKDKDREPPVDQEKGRSSGREKLRSPKSPKSSIATPPIAVAFSVATVTKGEPQPSAAVTEAAAQLPQSTPSIEKKEVVQEKPVHAVEASSAATATATVSTPSIDSAPSVQPGSKSPELKSADAAKRSSRESVVRFADEVNEKEDKKEAQLSANLSSHAPNAAEKMSPATSPQASEEIPAQPLLVSVPSLGADPIVIVSPQHHPPAAAAAAAQQEATAAAAQKMAAERKAAEEQAAAKKLAEEKVAAEAEAAAAVLKAKAEEEAARKVLEEKVAAEAKAKAELEAKEKADKEAKEKQAKEKEAKEKEAKEKADKEAKEKAEKEAAAKAAEAEAKAKAEHDAAAAAAKLAKEKAEAEAKEKADKEAAEAKLKAEKEAAEKAAVEKAAAEKAAAEKAAAEKEAAEKAAAEKVAAEKAAADKAVADKAAVDKVIAEKTATEKEAAAAVVAASTDPNADKKLTRKESRIAELQAKVPDHGNSTTVAPAAATATPTHAATTTAPADVPGTPIKSPLNNAPNAASTTPRDVTNARPTTPLHPNPPSAVSGGHHIASPGLLSPLSPLSRISTPRGASPVRPSTGNAAVSASTPTTSNRNPPPKPTSLVDEDDILCDVCSKNNASVHCDDCGLKLCTVATSAASGGCDGDVHKSLARASHKREPWSVEIEKAKEATERAAHMNLVAAIALPPSTSPSAANSRRGTAAGVVIPPLPLANLLSPERRASIAQGIQLPVANNNNNKDISRRNSNSALNMSLGVSPLLSLSGTPLGSPSPKVGAQATFNSPPPLTGMAPRAASPAPASSSALAVTVTQAQAAPATTSAVAAALDAAAPATPAAAATTAGATTAAASAPAAPAPLCDICEEHAATSECVTCSLFLCHEDDAAIHKPASKKGHEKKVL